MKRLWIGREGSRDKLIVHDLSYGGRGSLYVSIRIPFTNKRFRHLFDWG